ncbi:MAG TPA: tripartite tricarboxylate transporter substrate binding protein [Lysobacter sp.]|jgi:tripartite-type tricarboxylate transporter receptor subunit TctC|nr:tripartite tricarboxylate transporter substrate binding protein [Lysobacter sp.]
MINRRKALAAIPALGASVLASAAHGQAGFSFARKQIRFIVPFSAGGVADVTARIVLTNLAPALGAGSVIVENRPGANGNIGAEFVARQPADGLTYLIGPSSLLTMNPFVPELRIKSIDVTTQLQAVIPLADIPLALVVPADSSITNIDQFLAKARAGGLRIGNPGVGTPHHLAILLLAHANKSTFIHAAYKGGAPMIADLAGGHIDAAISSISSAEALVKSGRLRWIGTIQSGPPRAWRDVPSMLPQMQDATVPSWTVIFAPAGIPPDAIAPCTRRCLPARDRRRSRRNCGSRGSNHCRCQWSRCRTRYARNPTS